MRKSAASLSSSITRTRMRVSASVAACLMLLTSAAVVPDENLDGAAVIIANLLNSQKKAPVRQLGPREFYANRSPGSFKPCTLAHYLVLTEELQGCQMLIGRRR